MANLFPSSMDYISAIENPHNFVLDPVLKHGRPVLDRDGQLLCYSGEFTRVFRIAGGNQNSYALRCWTSDIGDAPRRYHAVSKYLAPMHLPFFTEFEYVSEGILVDGKTYPILRMDWVDAPSLLEFIGQHRNQPQVLVAAAESFLVMAKTLHQREIAHGDLQNENVKVHMSDPEFVLIDYDTLFVPDLAGIPVTNLGVPGFQHPKRQPVATKKDDYFAELVIYHALCALAEEPRLWDDYRMAQREKELIFSPEDFRSAVPGERFRRLGNLSPRVSKLTLLLWNYTRCDDTQYLIPLEEAVEICQTSAPEGWLTEWPDSRFEGRFDELLKPGAPPVLCERARTEEAAPPPVMPLLEENIQFTVYRPGEITPQRWYKMLIFTHLDERPPWLDAGQPSPLEEVEDEAQRILGPRLETYRKTTEESRLAVPRQGEITLVPKLRDIEFNPPTRSFSWKDGLSAHLETFELRAGPGFNQPTVARGRVTIFWGHLILAEVVLNIRVSQSRGSGTSAPIPSESSSARRFRRIFASYSHKDLEIVQEMERYSLSLGDRYLRDWLDLRAGERWNERLLGMVSEADIFQLFWSRNSSQSLYVEREWRHALSLRRETFIRPTYWEDPCPDPPEPLRPIQFQRLEIGRLLAPQPHPPSKEPSRFDALIREQTVAPPHPPSEEPSLKSLKFDDLIRQRTAPPRESPAPSVPVGRRGMRPIVLALVLAVFFILLGILILLSRS
jgi:TIR domain-containing protein